MEWIFGFAPLISDTLLWVLTSVVAIGIILAIARGLAGWWLRAFALIVGLIALANPVARQEERETISNIVFVVQDTTESQSVSDRPAQIEMALAGLRDEIGNLENFELREVRVENDISDRDSGSMVLTALAKAASEVAQNRIAGAIILTDGRIHDETVLTEFPAPVHVLQTGRAADWDRRLIISKAPSFAIVGEEIKLKLRIENDGQIPANIGSLARLEIAIDGEEPLQFQVRTNDDLELPISLQHGGINVIQFNVIPIDGELTDRNNSAVISINGVRDRLRVLLVSGEPHAGGRTWRNLLKSDSAVDLVHFTILRTQNNISNVPVGELSLIAFPTRELFLERIEDFDLIIFDKYRRRGLLRPSYLENVAEYVRNGGAVLFATGPDFAGANSLYRTALRDILPASPTFDVVEQGYKPRVSDLGLRHPVTQGLNMWAGAPDPTDDPVWGRWFRQLDVRVNSGSVVMEGYDDKPLLVLDRVGDGRVAMLLSDQAWLWSRGFEGGGPQLELLRRLAHWMMKEPELEEEQLSAETIGNRVFLRRSSLTGDEKSITITTPDGQIETLPLTGEGPGVWVGEFDANDNGLYRIRDGDLETVFAVGPAAPREFEKTIAGSDVLEPLVASTRGGVLTMENVPLPNIRQTREGRVAAGNTWIGLTPRNAYLTKDIRQETLLPGWAWLLLISLFTIAAWRREGR